MANRSTESRDCIMLFLREPRLGRVKTRLSRHLDENLVLDLYRAFVLDTLETVAACREETLIFVEPLSATTSVARWLGNQFTFVGQKGRDLGERMRNAFAFAFAQGFQRAVLIGSDTPDLPRVFIERSFDELKRKQAVIGPSTDGGYYLIGFSTQDMPADVFSLPTWGTGGVFSDTVSSLSRSGCAFSLLPEWADMDEVPDLKRFFSDGDEADNASGGRTRLWVDHHRSVLESSLAQLEGGHGA